jgi:uncharacterized protein YjaG (DUF416 family)
MAFDPDSLRSELVRLSVLHRVAFCASCCQRMLPNYEKFHRMEEWGNPNVLKTGLAEVWAFLAGQRMATSHLEALARDCANAAPDTERFSSLYTSSGLDAASSIVETLRCSVDGEPARAVQVATSARDSVDMYIQMTKDLDSSGPAMEEAIANDPLMRREIEKQQADLAGLRGIQELTPEFLARLRQSSSYDLLAP